MKNSSGNRWIRISQNAAVLAALILLVLYAAFTQKNHKLEKLSGYKFDVYYSAGARKRATEMAIRCAGAMMFYQNQVDFKPEVSLLVLDPEDWRKYSEKMVYGMPFYDDKKLIVASENNRFWQGFVPPADDFRRGVSQKIKKTYSDKEGNLTMQPFFDLLAVHELGHAFLLQRGLNMQRKWLEEFFANLFLYAYIAENEPVLLPVVTAFPEMVLATTSKQNLLFTSLADFENNYIEIAQNYPDNYGWYQCQLFSSAKKVYNAGGMEAFNNMWNAFQAQQETLDDEELVVFLKEKIHPKLADVFDE